VQALASFIDNVTFPMIGACNMDLSGEPSLDIKKWHVATVGGSKVGLLGYITPDTGVTSSSGNVTFSDPVRLAAASSL
jgi:2',3'-cyclic-nucleotide 2'-phosphodiesterase (5'-nucleotidase family)